MGYKTINARAETEWQRTLKTTRARSWVTSKSGTLFNPVSNSAQQCGDN
jgi:hypothetical protein